MKKVLALVLALSMVFVLCACGSDSKSDTQAETQSNTIENAVEATPVVMYSSDSAKTESGEMVWVDTSAQATPAAAQQSSADLVYVGGGEQTQSTQSGNADLVYVGGTGTETQAAAETEQASEVVCEANGYKVELKQITTDTDATGQAVIIVDYIFTNNNSTDTAFWEAVRETASQSGTKLNAEGAIMDYSILGTTVTPVSNGQSITVHCAYPAASLTTPVDVTCSIYNHSSGTVLATASGTMSIS